jgi:hypothetical protein
VATDIIEHVESVIVGHHEAIEHIVVDLLGRGHILLEDVPGVGKTMLARSVATSVDASFKRVQFTPDLLPTDVTGVNVYNEQTQSFEFRPGPIFANVVLGDEINRAPPKTQSALLEAMEEGQVSADGTTRGVPQPFTVIATQNTVEQHKAYDLPMAELDRFMTKLQLGYPDAEEAFGRALAAMDPERAREWEDVRPLLDRDARGFSGPLWLALCVDGVQIDDLIVRALRQLRCTSHCLADTRGPARQRQQQGNSWARREPSKRGTSGDKRCRRCRNHQRAQKFQSMTTVRAWLMLNYTRQVVIGDWCGSGYGHVFPMRFH